MISLKDQIKLHPAVVYREYDGTVLLYHTGLQKVFTFSGSTSDLLGLCKDWISIEDAVAELSKTFDVEDPAEFEKDVIDFYESALTKNILITKQSQKRRDLSFEREIPSISENGINRLNTVTFELTYKCNERCRHCYIAGSDRPELSKEKIISILDELADMKVMNIVFTGGELFTRSDTFEILEYAYSKNFLIEIYTNGNLLDGDDIIRLKAIWPKCIDFSVYSYIPEKHDAITQVKGSFIKTIETIRKCKLIGIPVNIKSPIFNETIDDVLGMIEMANELGVTIEPGINITPKKNGDLSPTKMRIESHEDYWQFYDTISSIYGDPDSTDEYKPPSKMCSAGENSISINPYGDVFPCNLMPLCIGNLIDNSIKDIWESSVELKKWRQMNNRSLRKECENCEHIEICDFCPGDALLRTGCLTKKYESACHVAEQKYNYKKRKGGAL